MGSPDTATVSDLLDSALVGGAAAPMWMVFLIFLGFVFVFGLISALRFRRIEDRNKRIRRHGSPEEEKQARRAAEEKVMPLLIESLEALDEQSKPARGLRPRVGHLPPADL